MEDATDSFEILLTKQYLLVERKAPSVIWAERGVRNINMTFREMPPGTYDWTNHAILNNRIIIISDRAGFWLKSHLSFMHPFRECDWTYLRPEEWTQLYKF